MHHAARSLAFAAATSSTACADDRADAAHDDASTIPGDVDGTAADTSGPLDPGRPTTGDDDDPSGFPTPTDVPDGVPPLPDSVPATCDDAALVRTSMGCEFLAIALENAGERPPFGPAGQPLFAVAVANVQREEVATVQMQALVGNAWTTLAEATVSPLDAAVMEVDAGFGFASGVIERGALRILADRPVTAVQFNSLTPVRSSDASLLLPTSSWDTVHRTMSRAALGHESAHSYVAIGAIHEVAGAAYGAFEAGDGTSHYDFVLGAADFLQVVTAPPGGVDPPSTETTSALVDSFGDPVAVFGGSACWRFHDGLGLQASCNHLEEQLPGVSWWGTTFVAARPPVRATLAAQQKDVWAFQVLAHHDDTTVTFEGDAAFAHGPVTLDAGVAFESAVVSTAEAVGDVIVRADKPVLVLAYSASGTDDDEIAGDPAMVLVPSTDQYLARHVVLAPPGWDEDWITIVRSVGDIVLLDGVAVGDDRFARLGDHEIARMQVDDGVHVVEGSGPLAVTVFGYGVADAYAYTGGLGVPVEDARPQG